MALQPTADELLRMIYSCRPPPQAPAELELDWWHSSSATSRALLRFGGIDVRLPSTSSHCDLPLKAITTQQISVARLFAASPDSSLERYWASQMILTDELALAHDASVAAGFDSISSDRICRNFSCSDIDMMMSTFLQKDAPFRLWQCSIFKVPKSDMIHSRCVSDGSDVSATIDWQRFFAACASKLPPQLAYTAQFTKQPKVRIPSFDEIIEASSRFAWGFQADAISFFYGIPIPKLLGQKYGVRIGSKRGAFYSCRHTKVPQGATWAPFVAQEVSNAFIGRVSQLCKLKGLQADDFAIFAWIDNYLAFATSEAAVNIIRDVMIAEAMRFDLPITAEEPSRRMEAIGIAFDWSAGHISVNEACKLKLKGFLRKLSQHMTRPPTQLYYLQMVGTIFWANTICLREPMCLHEKLMSAVRDVCSTQDWNAPVPNWSSMLAEDLRSLLHACIHQTRSMSRTLHYQHERAHAAEKDLAFVDASGAILAGVLQHDLHDTDRFSSVHPWPHHIFLAELTALVIGNALWPNALLVSDNTAAIGALRRGHSKTPEGDFILRTMFERMHGRQRAYVTWIATHLQRADKATRPLDKSVVQVPPHRQLIHPIVGSFWGDEGGRGQATSFG
jgi:hypothetical protein